MSSRPIRTVTSAAEPGWVSVGIGHARFQAPEHSFWPEFIRGWEETTWDFYARHVRADRPVLDLGAWIGPTILFAKALGAGPVLAVEASRPTAEYLEALKRANGFDDLTVLNRAIDPRQGTISFGGPDNAYHLSSASSVRGSGLEVETIRPAEIYALAPDPCLVKIDLEGSEEGLVEDLLAIEAPILFSLHPPFWSDREATADRVLAAVQAFHVKTPEGEAIAPDELRQRMTWEGGGPPSWGTPWGNFFEIDLNPR